MYTLEWNEGVLPHANILICLKDSLHVHRVDEFFVQKFRIHEKTHCSLDPFSYCNKADGAGWTVHPHHGQMYVGCSRVGKADNLYILAPNGRTANIEDPEAL
ncbi:hypothetical protein AVEN_138672-1 [Araneus ventricosus]|uniref:Uncharacterized protein n=1 Tax=Araneus ventricosus TaxID=182803 RepID=A0A4Y2X0A4_ARAVE|nr:hypothetical protein AVEN_138672-1 [Araneus ventricosus]